VSFIKILSLITKELGLSTVQKVKNDQKTKIQALHQEQKTRLQGVLTQEQMTKFDEIHQQRRNQQPRTGTGGGNVSP
jgi:bifunctional N-acetylglucosamine-1-phosphate-uridyltransferase/glucosamine-1-phosphate-acetyltransferase GlmU-like protein